MRIRVSAVSTRRSVGTAESDPRWASSSQPELTPALVLRAPLVHQPPHAFRGRRKLMGKHTDETTERGRDGAADRVAGTLTRALRAVRSRTVAALGEQVDDLVGDVAEARHAVIDDVGIRELLAVVDKLLVQRRTDPHHRRACVLAVDERGIDRDADIADRRELRDVDLTGLAVDGELETAAPDLVERRHLREAIGATDRAVPEHLAAR